MNNQPILYGIIGFLAGALIVLLLSQNAVNNQNYGMMRMMGVRGYISNIDRHFIEQMIPHHQNAITMAEVALEKSQRPEIKKLSEDIKRTQAEEIEKMSSWYKAWFGTEVPEQTDIGMGIGMMRGGMMGDQTDIERLKTASDFDKAFIEEMIPHHQMAIMMVQMLYRGTQRDQMKELAQDIINAQSKEINDMRSWYRERGY